MITHVWEVRTRGGEPARVHAAVDAAITHLRNGGDEPDLDEDELAPWREDIVDVRVSPPAVDGETVSVLVNITQQRDVGAVLSGGFDTTILSTVCKVPGVVLAEHSDRIERPPT